MRGRLDQLGGPGVAGIGLLIFCLSFLVGNVLPLRGELAELEAQKAQLTATVDALRGSAASTPGGSEALPPLSAAPELLNELNVLAAKHGIVVERSAYLLKDREGPLRLEVSMPLKVSYPALRAYLREALALKAAALDELTLQRTQASDTTLAAQLRLSFGFARSP